MAWDDGLQRCEYHDGVTFEDGDQCPACEAHHKREMAYWFARFDREPKPYTREEVEDCYSESSERNKRDILIERLGL